MADKTMKDNLTNSDSLSLSDIMNDSGISEEQT